MVALCLGLSLCVSLAALAQNEPAPGTTPPATATNTETNPGKETNEALRVSLELQEQIHAAQLALQKNREEQAALEKEVAGRLKVLEESVQTIVDDAKRAAAARQVAVRVVHLGRAVDAHRHDEGVAFDQRDEALVYERAVGRELEGDALAECFRLLAGIRRDGLDEPQA